MAEDEGDLQSLHVALLLELLGSTDVYSREDACLKLQFDFIGIGLSRQNDHFKDYIATAGMAPEFKASSTRKLLTLLPKTGNVWIASVMKSKEMPQLQVDRLVARYE